MKLRGCLEQPAAHRREEQITDGVSSKGKLAISYGGAECSETMIVGLVDPKGRVVGGRTGPRHPGGGRCGCFWAEGGEADAADTIGAGDGVQGADDAAAATVLA